MSIRANSAVVLAGLLATGCVIVPVTTASYDPDCRFVTHHMELQPVQLMQLQSCGDRSCELAVLAALGVTAVSAVVSGSIAVIGNVAYWAEHRANCPARPPEAAASAVSA
jgi:hypothetical protein